MPARAAKPSARGLRQPDFATSATRAANAGALMSFARVRADAGDRLERKRGLVLALDRLQATPTPGDVPALLPHILFADDARGSLGQLAAVFNQDDDGAPGPVVAIPAEHRDGIASGVMDGISALDDYHADYGALTRDLIAAIVVGTGSDASSATLSSQLATVYLNPPLRWGAFDFAEALLHEAMHLAHYLDQMIRPWFTRPHWEFAGPETSVVSAIRRVPRPLPHALEACCVATALVDLLWWSGARERATAMNASTTESLTGIRRLGDLLTPRGRDVVDDLHAILRASPALATVA